MERLSCICHHDTHAYNIQWKWDSPSNSILWYHRGEETKQLKYTVSVQ